MDKTIDPNMKQHNTEDGHRATSSRTQCAATAAAAPENLITKRKAKPLPLLRGTHLNPALRHTHPARRSGRVSKIKTLQPVPRLAQTGQHHPLWRAISPKQNCLTCHRFPIELPPRPPSRVLHADYAVDCYFRLSGGFVTHELASGKHPA